VTCSHDVYTSLAILTAWYHCTQREYFYGSLMSLEIMKSP